MLVLTASGSIGQDYRVDSGLTAHPLSHAEAARLAQREPGVPATLLPPDISRRVNAALSTLGHQQKRRRECQDAGRIAANARYIERELRQVRLG